MLRDDLYVNDSYAENNVHSEEDGKRIRKKIIFVTILLSAITAVEVFLGVFIKQGTTFWPIVKWAFIIMTLFKAGYIVLSFMHLGDERKTLKYTILAPYALFIAYLIFICLTEASVIFDLGL